MKLSCMLLAALLILSTSAWAQVGNGSKWTSNNGNGTVTITNTQNPIQNTATTQFTDSTGSSPVVPAASSGGNTVSECDPVSTSYTDPETGEVTEGGEYKIDSGKVLEKNALGKWQRMKETKKQRVYPEAPFGKLKIPDGIGTAPMSSDTSASGKRRALPLRFRRW